MVKPRRLTKKEWREAVFARDGKVCRNCGSSGRSGKRAAFTWPLSTHHILPEGRYPDLARDVSNGIVLCGVCHEETTGHERDLAPKFFVLIGSTLTVEEVDARYRTGEAPGGVVRSDERQSRALVEKLGWQDIENEIEGLEELEEQSEGGSEVWVRVRFRQAPVLDDRVLAGQLEAWFAQAQRDPKLRSSKTADVLRRNVGRLHWKRAIDCTL